MPTTPNLVRLGFRTDRIVCGECVDKWRGLGDVIAEMIRRIDGTHTMGAGALGEALANELRGVVLWPKMTE